MLPPGELHSPDLHTLLARGKDAGFHWFLDDVPLSRLAATLIGMANTAGGVVLLGVSPHSGSVQGVSDPAATLDRVFQTALLADPPLVLPIPRVLSLDGARLLWIAVPPGLPHVYNLEGRYLWREASQTNPIPARRLRQLLLERGIVQFETQVSPDSSLDDLDPEKVAAYIQSLSLPGDEKAAEILLRRGCTRPAAGEKGRRPDQPSSVRVPPGAASQLQPTYAALLLFGRQPQRWLPSATILAARFSGETFSDRFIKQDITGTLPDQLRQAELFVRDNLRSTVRLVGLTHEETLEYPPEAVRELLVNAVAHRDYSLQGDCIHLNIFVDRLEVSSPGGLPGPVNLDNLLEARFARNAVIVQVLSDLGFVERLGYGLDRVVGLTRQYGLRPPRFEEVAGSFRVTLFGKPSAGLQPTLERYRHLDLNPRQIQALTYLATYHRITSSGYQSLCPDVHPETLRRDLVDLINRGVLMKIGDKRATYYILK